jgi:hypothetical protein
MRKLALRFLLANEDQAEVAWCERSVTLSAMSEG